MERSSADDFLVAPEALNERRRRRQDSLFIFLVMVGDGTIKREAALLVRRAEGETSVLDPPRWLKAVRFEAALAAFPSKTRCRPRWRECGPALDKTEEFCFLHETGFRGNFRSLCISGAGDVR